MVKEYTTRYYVPAVRQDARMEQNHYQQARELAAWENKVRRGWPGLGLYVAGRRDGHFELGAGLDIRAWVRDDSLHPEDIHIDLVYGQVDSAADSQGIPQHTLPMKYTKGDQDGAYDYVIDTKIPVM